jgi:phosphate transport system protein
MTTHTSKDFEQELRMLRERLCAMGGRCEQQISLAMQALVDNDDQLARKVVKDDAAIDKDENDIDELALQILATRQPVASDLRFLTMSLKFVVDLERIGDLAAGIAKRVRELAAMPPLGPYVDLGRLAHLVQKNLHAALDSFVRRDADAATKVIAADVEIDKLNASLFAELIAHVATDPATVTRVIPLTSVCRYLERIGDHVKNLAEEVVYMVRATDVRHRPLPPAPHN